MKKVILSLIVGGLSISSSCFAADNSFDNGSKQDGSVAFREVKSDSTWSKVKVNAKKVLENKKFQVAAIGTAVVAGTAGAAVAAYYYSPSFAGLVKSNAKVIANYGSKASKVVANYRSKASERIKAFWKIKPATTASTAAASNSTTLAGEVVNTAAFNSTTLAEEVASSTTSNSAPTPTLVEGVVNEVKELAGMWTSTPGWMKWTGGSTVVTAGIGLLGFFLRKHFAPVAVIVYS